MIEDSTVPSGLALEVPLAKETRGLLVDLVRNTLGRHREKQATSRAARGDEVDVEDFGRVPVHGRLVTFVSGRLVCLIRQRGSSPPSRDRLTRDSSRP